MSTELRDRFHATVSADEPRPDLDSLWTRGRRRRRVRHVAMATAAAGLVGLAVVSVTALRGPAVEIAQGVSAVSAAPAGVESSVLEASADGVEAQVRVEADGQVCLDVRDTVRDEAWGHCDDLWSALADHGALTTVRLLDGRSVFVALLPDGYQQAVADDGRRWPVDSNLLIIVRDRDAQPFPDPLPVSVAVRGSADELSLPVRPIDPDLTETAEDWFRECMRDHGIELERIDIEVTPHREYALTGIAMPPTRGRDAPDLGEELIECENQMMRDLDLDPHTG